MATQRRIALAFAGSGQTSEENIKALLNDYLGIGPEDADGFPALPDEDELDVRIAFPVSETHLTDAVLDVVDWTEYADLAYEVITDGSDEGRKARGVLKDAENTIDTKNVNEGVISWLYELSRDKFEPVLILLWGEEGDDNAEILLDRAGTYDNFKVLDLTAGLDEINFEEDEPAPEPEPDPEPEPEPEPEEEKPARGRRRSTRQSLETEEKPLEDPEPEPAPAPETEPEKPTRRRRKAEPEPAPEEKAEEPVDEDPQESVAEHIERTTLQAADKTLAEAIATRAVTLHAAVNSLPDSREKAQGLIRLQEAVFWISLAVEGTKTAQPAQEAAEEPARGRGRPRKDGSPAKPRTARDKAVTEVWDDVEEAWVRKGRGRLPKDAVTRLVDPETGEPIDD